MKVVLFSSGVRKYEEEEGWDSWGSPAATPKVSKPTGRASEAASKPKTTPAASTGNQEWGSKWEDDAWEELNN
jgi:hypothetical protein